MLEKTRKRLNRKERIRAKVFGSATRPRLSVFRSASHISAQLIDDESSKTLAYSSDLKLKKE
jgi:large subunit ribosomal protein L18